MSLHRSRAADCVHDRFGRVAAGPPEPTAVSASNGSLSYSELDVRANRLAHHLRALGAGPEMRVGVMLRPTTDLVVTLLAVLKAGAAYVPLDPSMPPIRQLELAQ